MRDTTEQMTRLVKEVSGATAPAYLRGMILARIDVLAQRAARIRLASGVFLAAVSVMCGVVLMPDAFRALVSSQAFLLLFSDADVLARSIGVSALWALEAAPLAALTAFLSVIFLLSLSARLTASGRFVIKAYAAA